MCVCACACACASACACVCAYVPSVQSVSQYHRWTKRVTELTPREWTRRRQGRSKTKMERQPYPSPGSCVAKNSKIPSSVDTVQGGGSSLRSEINSGGKSRITGGFVLIIKQRKL